MTLDLSTISLVWGVIVSVLTSIGLVGGLIWRISVSVNAKFERLQAELERVEKDAALTLSASDGRAKIAEDELRRSIEAHKLFAAEHFATEEGVSKALDPVLKAIDRLADRLDKLLAEGLPARSPTRTR
jgi:hypothetical protein